MLKFLIKHLFFNKKNNNYKKTDEIEFNICVCCELCLSVCPTEAIEIFKLRDVICSYCNLCKEICQKKYCENCGYYSLFCPIPFIMREIPKPKTPIIDKKECNSCGLCSCEAIDIIKKEIDKDKCKLCLKCIDRCPMKAIKSPEEYIKSLFIKVDYDKCIFCRECVEICPVKDLENI
ncbi:4Fe-4S binding protein [Methanocaldococcus sp.]